jgi:CheY-like chemotaxis protein
MRQLEFLQPAIVLLNSRLPDIDGLYLVQSLRQNLSTRSLKIMSLLSDPPTSQTELRSVEAEWRQAGANEVIAHPMQAQIQPEILVQRVKALMD